MASLVLDLSNSLFSKRTNKEWIFKDLKSNYQIDKKDLDTNIDKGAINGGIKNIFQFRRGERILKPEFGNTLYKFVHRPINELVAKSIMKEIRSLFNRWEPRVLVRKVKVNGDPDNNQYHIEVFYSIPKLDNETLSYTYSLNTETSIT